VLYIGAGAVAAGGLIGMAQTLPTLWHSFARGIAGLAEEAGRGGELRIECDIPLRWLLLGCSANIAAITAAAPLHMNLLGALLTPIVCARHKVPKGEMLIRAKARIQGHLNYYAITDNARSCSRYLYHATRILRRWLNRKGQRKAYNWDQYNDVLRYVQWPCVQIRIDLNPFRREAC
jgi:hypothetical protein